MQKRFCSVRRNRAIPDLDLKDKNDNKIKGISPDAFMRLRTPPKRVTYVKCWLATQSNETG